MEQFLNGISNRIVEKFLVKSIKEKFGVDAGVRVDNFNVKFVEGRINLSVSGDVAIDSGSAGKMVEKLLLG